MTGLFRLDRTKSAMKRGLRAIRRHLWRLDGRKIVSALLTFGPLQKRMLMVHSSISSWTTVAIELGH